MDEIDARIASLDLTLFEHVVSQSTENDKRSLLALQSAVRGWHSSYSYLEIGSYLGGSLQPHVLDPRCGKIISIDPRPYAKAVRDQRGHDQLYIDNSAEGMLKLLAIIPGADLKKITTFEKDASALDINAVGTQPDYCFDGI